MIRSVPARDSFMHKVASKLAPTGAVGHRVASKLAPTGTARFWPLWERARTRQLRASRREQARSHRCRQGFTSRASSLPQVPSGFGFCGSVLARGSFGLQVASKLAPTGTERFWLLWERARTRQLWALRREQARSHRCCRASRREQARSHRCRAVSIFVGACSHATASGSKSRASLLPQVLSGIASRASSLPQGQSGIRYQCVSDRPANWSVWSSRVRVSISSSRSPCMISGSRYRVRLTRWSVMRPCGKL